MQKKEQNKMRPSSIDCYNTLNVRVHDHQLEVFLLLGRPLDRDKRKENG